MVIESSSNGRYAIICSLQILLVRAFLHCISHLLCYKQQAGNYDK
jgi:hypothetical protein